MSKIQGTVKWFSNKKGYGFITPGEGSPTPEDIFVHQSSIHSEGFRTLDEGWVVEFTIGEDDGERVKAESVTAPGGGPCTGPSSRRSRGNRRKPSDAGPVDHATTDEAGGGGDGGGHHEHGGEAAASGSPSHHKGGGRRGGQGRGRGGGGAAKTPRDASTFWHASLNPDVKTALEAKHVRATTGTIDVSIGAARVKLGTGGYASVAHADGVLGEGTFTADQDGQATFLWEKVMAFSDGAWKKTTAEHCNLPAFLSLLDDAVGNVKPEETALSLWGDVPADPRSALEANEFLMRRVVLTPKGGR